MLPGDGTLPADEVRQNGDRTETRRFVNLGDGQTQTFAAGPAGNVTISLTSTTLRIVSVDPASGWTVVKTSTEPGEVRVDLVNGAVTVRFDAEIEDGAVRVRVRQRGIVAVAGPAPEIQPSPRTDSSGSGNSGSGNSGSGNSGSGNADSGNSGSGSGHSGSDDHGSDDD